MWPQQTPGKRQLQSEGTLLARELGTERTATFREAFLRGPSICSFTGGMCCCRGSSALAPVVSVSLEPPPPPPEAQSINPTNNP